MGCCGGWWWWMWKRKDWWQHAQPLGLTEFLTPFQFLCLTAPSKNLINYYKYLYTHYIYPRDLQYFYPKLLMLFSVAMWIMHAKLPKQVLDIFIAPPTGLLNS
jgi:hypothetical protein